ncbi:prepilin-type N-terminal cleavage/methylation domain-containing protein [bacterium]|nr:prepilin-type N-terminal cleavage/methylation domain-containing protein [bacterium]
MRYKYSFTLIELLIVVAIIGILAAIAVPNFLNAQIRAKIARVESDHKTIATALEQYRLDNNTYPMDADDVNRLGFIQLSTPVPYLSIEPVDPFIDSLAGGESYGGRPMNGTYQMGTGNSNQLGVANPETKDLYILTSNGPDRIDDSQPIMPFPVGNPTRYLAFEASNGLHSKGDIWRFGGAPVPAAFRQKVSYAGWE